MPNAFSLFEGLEVGRGKNISTQARVLGEPCIHEHHYTAESGFRQGSTQACLSCIEALETPRISFDYSGLRPGLKNKALNFWDKVDILDWSDCWAFQHETSKKLMRFTWRRPLLYSSFRHHPIRVAMWLSWGDLGQMGTISRCGQRRCVNPLHNLPSIFETDVLLELDRADLDKQLASLKQQVQEYRDKDHKILITDLEQQQFGKAYDALDRYSTKDLEPHADGSLERFNEIRSAAMLDILLNAGRQSNNSNC
jgi:hypothetical protein